MRRLDHRFLLRNLPNCHNFGVLPAGIASIFVFVLLILLSVMLVTGSARADSLTIQRLAFKAADEALQQGKAVSFAALKNYPLYPYLLYRDLTQRLDENPRRAIETFLVTYTGSPLAARLRTTWLRHLAKEERWRDFLQVYQTSNSVELDCWYRQALLHAGRRQEALEGIEQVWMSGTSRPAACDPLFQSWRERGSFTRERLWQRFGLAMDQGETGLARYLQGLLPAADQSMANLWLQVDGNPRLILEQDRFDTKNPHTTAILLHGLERWSHADSVSAAAALDTIKQRYALPENELASLERQIALFVASRGHPQAITRLTALPSSVVDTQVREWRVRTGLQHNDWRATLHWVKELSPEESKQPQWQYWQARALEVFGRQQEAQRIYRHLANQRDYHSFLAADRLGLPYQMDHNPISTTTTSLARLNRLPGIQRARELYLLGRRGAAHQEWQYVVANLNDEDLVRAAKLAQQWGWHHQAIATVARAGHWDDLELRFPLPFRNTVLTYARDKRIDPAWIYAVMRQESLFRADIRSSAGALGLMQIMPATGRRIAQDLQLTPPNRWGLLQVDTNIRYGTHYLRHMLGQLQENPLLATAAYNAGPHKVERWLPVIGPMEADRWAETIPYYETRDYVKRVMEYAVVYQWRLGLNEISISSRMGRVLPRYGSVSQH